MHLHLFVTVHIISIHFKDQFMALMHAAKQGNFSIVECLIDAGADATITDNTMSE